MFAEERAKMVQEQLRQGGIQDERVLDAMASAARARPALPLATFWIFWAATRTLNVALRSMPGGAVDTSGSSPLSFASPAVVVSPLAAPSANKSGHVSPSTA